jgi:hypothetical protein
MFAPQADMNDAISYLVREGCLHRVLAWIADWLYFRDVDRSLVVRYEDFVTDRRMTLNRVACLVHGNDIGEEVFSKCESDIESIMNKRSSHINSGDRRYPCGWTGKIDTWRDYFTERNRQDYLSVVNDFLKYYPHASLVLNVYPNLLMLPELPELEHSSCEQYV